MKRRTGRRRGEEGEEEGGTLDEEASDEAVENEMKGRKEEKGGFIIAHTL